MIGDIKPCPMYIGIKNPGMTKALILQVPKEFAPLSKALPESNGFDFSVYIAGDEIAREHVSIILSASKADYNDIFSTITDDIYVHLEPLHNLKEIISAFLSRVRLWQNFFERQSSEGLSDAAQKGLYGEIYFLKNYLLSQNFSHEAVIGCWTGSKNRQHDFQFGRLAVEVKTTSSKQHQKLQIASEQQLDETFVDMLYLFYISVSLQENHDNTLPHIIRQVRNLLGAGTLGLGLFNNLLLERGCLDIHFEKYANTGYSLRDSKFFRVEADFPRIKENELKVGVGDVGYSIAVAECLDYAVSEDEFIKAVLAELS